MDKEKDLEFEEPKKSFFQRQKSEFKEASQKGPGALFKTTLTKPLYPIFWLLKILALLIGFLAAAIILFTLFNFLTGGGTSLVGTESSIFLSETKGPLQSIINPIKNFVFDPVGTIAEYGTFKSPTTIETKKPQGVEFSRFETKKPIYSDDEDIETIANVKIYGAEDSITKIDFSCSIAGVVQEAKQEIKEGLTGSKLGQIADIKGEQPAKEIRISGQSQDTNLIEVFSNQIENVNVICKFSPQKIEWILFEKKTISKKVTLKANYPDYITRSRLKVYTLNRDTLNKFEKENKNPFTEFKVKDYLISSDRSVRSEQLKESPGTLSLNLIDAQPLTEGSTYLLAVELTNNKASWNGKLSSLSSLKLFFNDGFVPDEDCKEDFSIEGNILTLKPSNIDKINKDGNGDIDKVRFFCDFTIDSSIVKDNLEFSLINAEAKFDYEFEAFTSAIISNKLLSPTTA